MTENSIFLHMVIWASESVSDCLVSRVSAWKTINRLEYGSEAPFLEFLSFSLGYLGGFLETACVLVVCLHSCTFGGVVLLKSLPSLHSTTSISALVLCMMSFPLHSCQALSRASALEVCKLKASRILQAWQDNSNFSLESWGSGRSGGIYLA